MPAAIVHRHLWGWKAWIGERADGNTDGRLLSAFFRMEQICPTDRTKAELEARPVIANTNIFRGMAGDLIGRRETRQHREHAARTTLTSEAMTYADSERPAWYLNSQLAAATSGNSRRHEAPRRMSLIGCHAGAAVLTKSVSRLICARGIARMSHHVVRLARVQRPTAKKAMGVSEERHGCRV